ncbi:NAD-dependent epimerase/dehydratase family protein [Crateriforma conspicua]|uniref:NAD-dependent epimerase/dehydratase family protein n=1 Tax=Crateriforma conspicua TaxID=2527996 RepID=UPI00118BD414|nr:NAD-dependent epimerase/dehydratase family protein [Crateriforma conspicua]QDV63522.1 3 beta-hydroxysteroid dehydrogenase/Delta 5-->4-isomerase [Crateriforma conspicua]
MTRCLVTGCGGFLGAEIVRQLLRRGDEVIGVSRREYPELVDAGMTHRRGDLSDRDWTMHHVRDVDVVVHTAAIAGVWGAMPRYLRNNVLTTRHIIDACHRHSIGRLVYTSSPSVTFDGQDQSGVDESAPYPAQWMCNYPRSKAMAEAMVIQADDATRLRTCSLRPHLIWGEGDPHLLPRLIDRAARGRLAIIGDGKNRIDMVHVVNAAHAHVCAIDALEAAPDRAAGRNYFIGQNEPVDCWPWITRLCETAGVKPPTRQFSLRTARAIGVMLEAAYHLTARSGEPPMTRFVAAQMARDHYFDGTAATERLGYQPPLTMQQGLDATAEYLRTLGDRTASGK